MNLITSSIRISKWAALLVVVQTGCITSAHKYVPANRVPRELLAASKSENVPINLALLGQPVPPAYIVGPHDVLGVYVQGILPAKADELPIVNAASNMTAEYYPANGLINSPIAGVPIQVQSSGVLPLPLVNGLTVDGLTIEQTGEAIRKAYLAMGILQEGRDRIYVTLARSRVTRVLVIREDVASDMPQQMRKDSVVYTRRGRAETLDLPAFENDVLHALTATGGLPGIDAYNEVWVLRGAGYHAPGALHAKNKIDAGDTPSKVLEELKSEMSATRIPLRLCASELLPFGPQDVILQDGDIVFVAPRDNEFFYTGGLLPGGQVPLPRDHDVDIIEAITLAQGSIGGPGGVSGTSVFRTGAGPGNIVPPTRALVVRKLPNGQQIPIRADLARAMTDPKERFLIQPGDLVMLQYKPHELAENVLLNFFNFSVTGLYAFQQ